MARAMHPLKPNHFDRLLDELGLNKVIEGDTLMVVGNTFPVKDRLKSWGLRWDTENKTWWHKVHTAQPISEIMLEVYRKNPVTWNQLWAHLADNKPADYAFLEGHTNWEENRYTACTDAFLIHYSDGSCLHIACGHDKVYKNGNEYDGDKNMDKIGESKAYVNAEEHADDWGYIREFHGDYSD